MPPNLLVFTFCLITLLPSASLSHRHLPRGCVLCHITSFQHILLPPGEEAIHQAVECCKPQQSPVMGLKKKTPQGVPERDGREAGEETGRQRKGGRKWSLMPLKS